jgi:hypothetical protein
MDFNDDMPIISSFKELMNEISWSWNYPEYEFIKYDGGYVLNKLYIEPDCVKYKTDTWYLSPGVYEDFEAFLRFLNGLENNE